MTQLAQNDRLPVEGSRLANIDVLRGLAALLVVLLHASEVFVTIPAIAAHGRALADVSSFLELGRAGVVAFFAISGFVITPTIRGARVAGTQSFLIKRFFRLYPPFWFALSLTYLMLWSTRQETPSAGAVLANITMVPTWLGQAAAMGHFWTLEVELVFYLLVVLLFWNGWLQRRGVLLTLIVLLVPQFMAVLVGKAAFATFQGHWGLIPYSLAIMLWSSLLRQAYDPGATTLETMRRWLTDPVILTASLLVVGRALLAGKVWDATLMQYLSGKGTLWGLLLFLAFALTRIRWPSAVVWTGTVSYSVYLLHPVVFYPMYFWVSRHDGVLAQQPLAVYVVVALAATLAVASVSYVLIERPSNEFARRLSAGLRAPAGSGVARI